MHSKLFLLLICSFSLYGSAEFPKQTTNFLVAFQQQMTNTPSPAALQEVGAIHARFRSAQHRVGKKLCCYATPCVCCCPVGGSLCITATAGCAVGACCMVDATAGCTDSFGFPFAEFLTSTHRIRLAQNPATKLGKKLGKKSK